MEIPTISVGIARLFRVLLILLLENFWSIGYIENLGTMNKGFIKEIALKIGVLIISFLTIIGVIEDREPLPPAPPIVFEEPEAPEIEPVVEEEVKPAPEPAPVIEFVEPPLLEEFVEEIVPVPGDFNSLTRDAVVNIFCVSKDSRVNSITGSGIVIDPRGIILTNAHIGQYFFLNEYTDCTIRKGSPAINAYKAEALYVSPDWVLENYQAIAQDNPRGTGERDFALLQIKESTNPNNLLPEVFSFVLTNTSDETPKREEDVLIVGYPAGFLGGDIIQSNLNILSTTGEVSEIYTFANGSTDLFSVFGSLLAQRGASGGAVVDDGGRLVGIIVTASQEETTGMRELRAITLSHINKSLIDDLDVSLSSFLLGNLDGKGKQFRDLIAPGLRELLLSVVL